MQDSLRIGHYEFESRLFIGTGKFASDQLAGLAVQASGARVATVALRLVNTTAERGDPRAYLPEGTLILANTSGARTAAEAVILARAARALCGTDLIKIEITRDPRWHWPDDDASLKATDELAAEGFVVLPYMSPDPERARRFRDAGAAAVMPLGSPIGTNKGIAAPDFIRMIVEAVDIPVIVDAGLGRPSHAAQALELGAAAVLVNTAIATAADPEAMARAFAEGVRAGRRAYLAGAAPERELACASSPLTGFLGTPQ